MPKIENRMQLANELDRLIDGNTPIKFQLLAADGAAWQMEGEFDASVKHSRGTVTLTAPALTHLPPYGEYVLAVADIEAQITAFVTTALQNHPPVEPDAAEPEAITVPDALPMPADPGQGARLIAEERLRQQREEGYTLENDVIRYPDAENGPTGLALAAACYAAAPHSVAVKEEGEETYRLAWPFDPEYDKRQIDDFLQLRIKAGALIAAEIDVLLAQASAPPDEFVAPPETEEQINVKS